MRSSFLLPKFLTRLIIIFYARDRLASTWTTRFSLLSSRGSVPFVFTRMSNIRQRIPKTNRPSPGRMQRLKQNSTSSRWDISSDDRLADIGAGISKASMGSIPMYNPLHYQSSDDPMNLAAPALSSNPLSWEAVMAAKALNKSNLGKQASGDFIGFRGSHLPSLAPAFIPDSKYQAYLLGRPKQKEKSGINRIMAAKFCAKFSIVATMFLMFVGILVDTQPMYLPGILPQHIQYTTGDRKAQKFYAVVITDRLEQASRAYRAAFLYLITAGLCAAYAYNAHWWLKRRCQQYHDVPDDDSTVPTFHNGLVGGRDDLLLPTSVKNFPPQRWNNAWAIIHRVVNYLASIWPEFQERRRNRRQLFAGSKDV